MKYNEITLNEFINENTNIKNLYSFPKGFKSINKQKKLFHCNICNNEFEATISNVLKTIKDSNGKSYYCPYCTSNKNKDKNNNNSMYNLKPLSKEYENKFLNRIREMTNKDLYSLPKGYYGNKNKSLFHCNICNNEFEATPTNIILTITRGIKSGKNNYYCPYCNKLVHKNNIPYEQRLHEVNKNIINLEPYKNRKTKIKHKCLICNNEWYVSPNNLLSGEGCPNCANIKITSTYEDDIYNYIKSFYKGEIIRNSRNILNQKELDLYIPEFKIAFEIDGIYWHNYERKGIQYHLDKTKEANKLGITLYHIFTSELEHKKDIVYSKIKYLLKCSNNEKIYARKCYVEEINSKDKNKFLEENHIQGKDKASIKLGLWYPLNSNEDLLVAVMTFSKPSKAKGQKSNSKYDYELSRFATNIEYNVIGSFSKLFKYFKRNYKWSRIITYADKRWSNGNLYITNNFIHTHDSKPDYWYFHRNDDSILYHRYNFRKDQLKELFPNIYKDDLSEYQIMKEANYLKIYDCGNMVFEYIR